MKCIVDRVSTQSYYNETQPCEEAYSERKEGADRLTWYVDINTLEELNAFVDKYGEIIFNGDYILIYDDYVE